MYNSGVTIFDYGAESDKIYIIIHGKIDVMIPGSSMIQIDEDKELESKVVCLAYCIINFENIMWRVMTYEVEYTKPFDIKD